MIVEANIVEKGGSVYMLKSCARHGNFEVQIAKYAWFYGGLHDFYRGIFPQNGHNYSDRRIKRLQFYPTLRCNLNCKICFTRANENIQRDVPLEVIKKRLKIIKNQKRHIAVLGGEPTVREDIMEIMQLIKESGNKAHLFTNGIKLEDIEYLKELKINGLNFISIWLDALKDDGIYMKIRGYNLLERKREILNNLKKLNIPTRLIYVIVRGINENEILDCINFARENSFIKGITFRSYSHLGRRGFSLSHEFLIDELIEVIQEQTNGLITLEDAFYFQKIVYGISSILNIPQCEFNHIMILPRNNALTLRDTFNFCDFSKKLEKFVFLYRKNPLLAKGYFVSRLMVKLIKNPLLAYLFIRQATAEYKDECVFPNSYIFISMAKFYNSYNYNLNRCTESCHNLSFDDHIQGSLVPQCRFIHKEFDLGCEV